MDIQIRRYTQIDRDTWDSFVKGARNATFLFLRSYMDYHADRFSDCSLMAFREGSNRPIVLLPANITSDGTLHSHQGLTYGGWILPRDSFNGADMLRLFDCWLAYCRTEGIRAIDYKPLPYIYAAAPAQEDLYALWRHGAAAAETTLSSAIDLAANPGFHTLQRRLLRKALAHPCEVVTADTEEQVRAFWEMLAANLRERHDTRPVHTHEELWMLRERFPDNISVRLAVDSDGVQAGVCLYLSERVMHAQYIASTPRGRELHLLPLLFSHLIAECRDRGIRYFDFGISCEDGGTVLNEGLLRQKSGFGATCVVCQRFLLSVM